MSGNTRSSASRRPDRQSSRAAVMLPSAAGVLVLVTAPPRSGGMQRGQRLALAESLTADFEAKLGPGCRDGNPVCRGGRGDDSSAGVPRQRRPQVPATVCEANSVSVCWSVPSAFMVATSTKDPPFCVYASLRPSADHTGFIPFTPNEETRLSDSRSVRIVEYPSWNAIRCPSGDHCGCWHAVWMVTQCVSCVGWLPSAFMIQISLVPERSDMKAIRLPSGENEGMASFGPVVSWRTAAPLAFMRWMKVVPVPVLSWTENAICF